MNVQDEQVSKETFEVSHWVMMGCWLLIIFLLGDKPVHLDEANFGDDQRRLLDSTFDSDQLGRCQINLHLMFCRIHQGWCGYCSNFRQRLLDWLDAIVGFTMECAYYMGDVALYTVQ